MNDFIKNFNDFVLESKQTEEREMQTIKSKILDYAEKLGEASWKELQNYAVSLSGVTPSKDTRGRYASYFAGQSSFIANTFKDQHPNRRDEYSHGLLMRPTEKDLRYLEKQPNGKYIVKVAEKPFK